MPSLNRVVLIGRLTRDPEMRHTTSGLAMTTFSLAVDRRYKTQSGERQTDFIRCKAWRQKAEFVSNYITKGRLVAVEGSIETSEVVGQDGVKKYFTDIVCDNVEILESNRDQGDGGSTPVRNANDYNAASQAGGAGYFPDDDMSATPRANASQPVTQAAPRPQATGGAAPKPAYPQEDFDDSDPFADE